MSNINAIGLILATLVAGVLATVYATTCTQLRSDGISTGVVRGVAISNKARLMILFQEYVPMAFGIAAFDVILALGFVQIAGNVVDPQVKTLAWLSAALSAFGCAGWLIQGGLYVTNWFSILRERQAD